MRDESLGWRAMEWIFQHIMPWFCIALLGMVLSVFACFIGYALWHVVA